MSTCLECEYLMPSGIGPALSWCSKQQMEEKGIAVYKELTPPFREAETCSMFKQLEDVVTDTREFVWDPKLRCYGDHAVKSADTSVDAEKLDDEKFWG